MSAGSIRAASSPAGRGLSAPLSPPVGASRQDLVARWNGVAAAGAGWRIVARRAAAARSRQRIGARWAAAEGVSSPAGLCSLLLGLVGALRPDSLGSSMH